MKKEILNERVERCAGKTLESIDLITNTPPIVLSMAQSTGSRGCSKSQAEHCKSQLPECEHLFDAVHNEFS